MIRKLPFRLGLTGSMAMGKSTTADMFRAAGVPVWDADATVHALYGPKGGAVAGIQSLAPEAVVDDRVDRTRLSRAIAKDPDLLTRVETLVHPLVQADRQAFTDQTDAPVIVYDIPLLYETGADAECDAVLVVTAPKTVQRERILARPGMTEAGIDALLARQMPDAEKRAKADFIIDTSLGIETARDAVHTILSQIGGRNGA